MLDVCQFESNEENDSIVFQHFTSCPSYPQSSTECNSPQPTCVFHIELAKPSEMVQDEETWEMAFPPEDAARTMGSMYHSILLFIKLCGIEDGEEWSPLCCCHSTSIFTLGVGST